MVSVVEIIVASVVLEEVEVEPMLLPGGIEAVSLDKAVVELV